MRENSDGQGSTWKRTPVSNLVRYGPSGVYFARVRVGGKLIRRSLKTNKLGVAQLRLGELVKDERAKREARVEVSRGRMRFGDAVAIHLKQVEGNVGLKPNGKLYRKRCAEALVRSWPGLLDKDVHKISERDCLHWAAEFGKRYSASVFNNTVGSLRQILEIAVKEGSRYGNPALAIKKARIRQKALDLPEHDEFLRLVESIGSAGAWCSRDCADLVRFLAFGGFRKGEAGAITWADCDFEKREIVVRGDAETGTKNWTIRRVPMIPDMLELLQRLRQDRQEEPLTAHVMKVRECQKAIDSACKKLGTTRFTHHDLRHLFATRCIESGVDIPTVSRWLGHKDGGALAMKVYGHLRDEHSVDMAQRVTFKAVDEEGIIRLKRGESAA
jgi:integrase